MKTETTTNKTKKAPPKAAAKKKTTRKAKPKDGFTDGKVTYSPGSIEYNQMRAAKDLEEQGSIQIDQMAFIVYDQYMGDTLKDMLESMGGEHAHKILPLYSEKAYDRISRNPTKKKAKKSRDDDDFFDDEDDDFDGYDYRQDEREYFADIGQSLAGKYMGQLVVEVSTPVYRWSPPLKGSKSKEGSTWFSDGMRTMNWFAGWDILKIITEANAWAERSQEEDVARAKAAHFKTGRKPKKKI